MAKGNLSNADRRKEEIAEVRHIVRMAKMLEAGLKLDPENALKALEEIVARAKEPQSSSVEHRRDRVRQRQRIHR